MIAMSNKKFIAKTVLPVLSMKLEVCTVVFVLALLFSVVTALQLVNPVSADMMAEKISPICIRSDGSIEPLNSLLTRTGNVYTFTGSSVPSFETMGIGGYHVHTIVIQRDNVVLDGAGYELDGPGGLWTAITINDVTNVTVKRVEINNFQTGVAVSNSSNIIITQNIISANSNGVMLASSNYNTISQNNLTGNYNGFSLTNSNYNSINGNIVSYGIGWSGSSYTSGFYLSNSSNNTLIGNSIATEGQGINFNVSSNNTFLLNDFINNGVQVTNTSYSLIPSKNFWDDGATGNFWSNYTGLDSNKDGTGDDPFIIDSNNVDRYPLMNPIYVTQATLPNPFDKGVDHSQQGTAQPPSPSPTVTSSPGTTQTLISMPQEYLNYTISNINGSLWATVDGVYPMHISPELVGHEIQMMYPTPTGTTGDIRIDLDGQEVSWSNYTQTNPAAFHYTYLGEWPMINCAILPASADFVMRIHYQHPIMQANGSCLFLYDLNINSYLSNLSSSSTATFNVRFETNCSNIQVYTVPSDSSIPRDSTKTPVIFVTTYGNNTQTVTFNIISDYSKSVPGDELITFEDSQAQVPEFPSWVILPICMIMALMAVMIVRRKNASVP